MAAVIDALWTPIEAFYCTVLPEWCNVPAGRALFTAALAEGVLWSLQPKSMFANGVARPWAPLTVAGKAQVTPPSALNHLVVAGVAGIAAGTLV